MSTAPHAAATAPTPPTSTASWKPSKLETKLLTGIWERAKPALTTAWNAAKAWLSKALEGQPLLVIGGFVTAIDAFLLNGPKPMPAGATKVLVGARTLILRLLEPPKPISAKVRQILAGIVTLAGVLGVWARVKPVKS